MSKRPGSTESEPIWLVDPKRSPIGFWLVSAGGLLLLAAAVALGLQLASTAELALAAILVTGGFFFLSVAIVLGAARGGAALFPAEQVVRLFGRSSGDAYAVPLDHLTAIRVIRRSEQWGRDDAPVLISSVELATRAGPTLHLLEFGSLEDAREAALMFRTVLKLPVTEPAEPALQEEEELPEGEKGGDGSAQTGTAEGAVASANEGPEAQADTGARTGTVEGVAARSDGDATAVLFREQISVGPGWGLGVAVLPAALFSLLTGGLLLAGVNSTGVLGFLFGPVALFTGVGLGVLWLYKAFGREVVIRETSAISVSCHWGPFQWGKARLDSSATPPRCRLRSRGPNGFCVEALADGHIVLIGVGSGQGTRTAPERLFDLARRLEGR